MTQLCGILCAFCVGKQNAETVMSLIGWFFRANMKLCCQAAGLKMFMTFA